MGVRYLLDAGQEREKERLRTEATRKAQLVILHLQEAITILMERVQRLQDVAADAETNHVAIFQLNERLPTGSGQEGDLIAALLRHLGHLISDGATPMGLPAPLLGLFQGMNSGAFGAKERTIGQIARWMS